MENQLPRNGYLLGLDVGEKRIGVALASEIARLPQPIAMIYAGETAIQQIKLLVNSENVTMIIIGIPRNLAGYETAQSQAIRDFASDLKAAVTVPVVFADETLSSVRAGEMLKQPQFKDVSKDSLAACFILEEFLSTNKQGSI